MSLSTPGYLNHKGGKTQDLEQALAFALCGFASRVL